MSVLKIKREDGTWESIIGGGSGNSFLDIPTFDLSEMGMPPIPLDGGTVVFNHDLTELQALLAKGEVLLTIDVVDNYGDVYPAKTIAKADWLSNQDYYQINSIATNFNTTTGVANYFMLITANVFADRILVDVSVLNTGTNTGTKSAVLYTAQALTEAQKAQARANIGAAADAQPGNVIPTPTEEDYGKFLSATPNGFVWVTPIGGDVPSAEGVEF